MEVNVHHARTNLSRLSAAAESGEEVIIARNRKPAVKLVVVEQPRKLRKSRRSLLGSGIGKLWIGHDFESPESSAEIADLFRPATQP